MGLGFCVPLFRARKLKCALGCPLSLLTRPLRSAFLFSGAGVRGDIVPSSSHGTGGEFDLWANLHELRARAAAVLYTTSS